MKNKELTAVLHRFYFSFLPGFSDTFMSTNSGLSKGELLPFSDFNLKLSELTHVAYSKFLSILYGHIWKRECVRNLIRAFCRWIVWTV